jgi:hypothetical protein
MLGILEYANMYADLGNMIITIIFFHGLGLLTCSGKEALLGNMKLS